MQSKDTLSAYARSVADEAQVHQNLAFVACFVNIRTLQPSVNKGGAEQQKKAPKRCSSASVRGHRFYRSSVARASRDVNQRYQFWLNLSLRSRS
jgi:hypothetical protein